MDIDKSIQEILQRSLPVNDNCVCDENSPANTKTPAKKTDYFLKSINIVGDQNIVIATNSVSLLILVLLFCVYIFR